MRKIVCTHSGEGHIDDWFAVAIFLLANPEYKLIRSRDKKILSTADALIDVGNKYDPSKKHFDHHQSGGAGQRPNGIPYASAGLVWKEYGPILCEGDTLLVDNIDRVLISFIDSMDTRTEIYDIKIKSAKVYSIREYFYTMFRPLESDRGDLMVQDWLFDQAVEKIQELIKMEIVKGKETQYLIQLTKKAYEKAQDKRFIIFTQSLPFQKVLPDFPEPLFAILPYQGTKFVAITIKEKSTSIDRLPFPKEWRSKSSDELVAVTGISDLEFCHDGGYMMTSNTLNSLVAAVQKAIGISLRLSPD